MEVSSGGLFAAQQDFQARHLIAQRQTALFHPSQSQLVALPLLGKTINERVQIRMLNAHLNQLALRRMQRSFQLVHTFSLDKGKNLPSIAVIIARHVKRLQNHGVYWHP